MKVERCVFSGFKIYPQRGVLFIRADAKIFRFVDKKSRSHFTQRHFPRKLAWTQIYRRMHKKGIESQVARKKARKVVKFNRGIIGATVEDISAKKIAHRDAKKKAAAAAAAAPNAAATAKAKKAAADKKDAGAAQKAVKMEKSKAAAPAQKAKGGPKGGR